MVKAKIYEISSNTYELYNIPLYHFTIIIIIFDMVLRQKINIEHEKYDFNRAAICNLV